MASVARTLQTSSLVELIQSAVVSADAEGVFYLAAIGRVRRFLRRHFPDAPDEAIEDWASDTLAMVLSKLSTCRATTDAGVSAWIFTAAWRTVLSDMRSHPDAGWFNERADRFPRGGHNVDVSESSGMARPRLPAADPDDYEVPLPPDEPAFADQPISVLVAATVARAQRTLPEPTQELLYRRIIERESWKTLARVAGTTTGGCKRRFQRAQARLRRQTIDDLSALPEPLRTRAMAWAERQLVA